MLRGPVALFGVRGSAKLVRDLAKHRRTPMSPPQLIPPTSPVAPAQIAPTLNGDLTEVRRTRPERTMSGVVRGMAESSVPGKLAL